MNAIKPVIVGCSGTELTAEERAFFQAQQPYGFILFQRNCEDKAQVTKLVSDLRDAVGRSDAPVLIDQEGGTVARLKEPAWREYPAARHFGELYKRDPKAGLEAARLNARLMAEDLYEMGITVNCAPVLDVPSADCHGFLSDSRVFDDDAQIVAVLGNTVCQGLMEGGVTPVLKHIPGHGRGKVDSHFSLPEVGATRADMAQTDFAPFKALSNDNFWAMTAHVLYKELDPEKPASVSRTVIQDVVRGEMGFNGVLIADDITMQALEGSVAERALATLSTGTDLTLHCNGKLDQMREILGVLPAITDDAMERIVVSEQARIAQRKDDFVADEAVERLGELLQERFVA